MGSHLFEATAALAAGLAALAAGLAALASVLSGICAFLSFRLSKALWNELKSDERILVTELIHPSLNIRDHSLCVLQFTLFNKSKRKAFISSLEVKDSQGKQIDVDWADRIDQFGNPIAPKQIAGIVDSTPIFIRRRSAQPKNVAVVEIYHSFSDSPLVIEFNEYKNLKPDTDA